MSAALHSLALLLLGLGGQRLEAPTVRAPSAGWVGSTFEVEGLELAPPLVAAVRSAGASAAPTEPLASPAAPPPAPPRSSPRPRRRRPRSEPAASAVVTAAAPPGASAEPGGESSGAAPAAVASGGGSAAAGGGSFGAEGLPPGVRSLDAAFARALPRAMDVDPVWLTLPVGELGQLRVTFTVDAEGRLAPELETDGSALLERVVERARLLLGRGAFALRASGVEAGRRRYAISARLSLVPSEAAPEDGEARPHTIDLGFTAPSAERPGAAHFTLRGGRRVDFSVRVLPGA